MVSTTTLRSYSQDCNLWKLTIQSQMKSLISKPFPMYTYIYIYIYICVCVCLSYRFIDRLFYNTGEKGSVSISDKRYSHFLLSLETARLDVENVHAVWDLTGGVSAVLLRRPLQISKPPDLQILTTIFIMIMLPDYQKCYQISPDIVGHCSWRHHIRAAAPFTNMVLL